MKTVDDIDGIDPGIRHVVAKLLAENVETFESCEGGPGHVFDLPTVRFHGGRGEGFRALALALMFGLPVDKLSREWSVIDGEPTGPHWVLTFAESVRGMA